MSQFLPYLAPIAGATSAIIAMLAFLRTQKVRREDIVREAQIRDENTRRERLKEARAAWAQYLALAFDNPRFSSGFELSAADRESIEKYEWYVTAMLFSGEGILDAAPSDAYWRNTLKTQFDHHRDYLTSPAFANYLSGYSPAIQDLHAEWKRTPAVGIGG